LLGAYSIGEKTLNVVDSDTISVTFVTPVDNQTLSMTFSVMETEGIWFNHSF